MKRLAAAALVAATAVLAASSSSLGAANPSGQVPLTTTGTWAFAGLTPVQHANVAADIASAMPAARPVLDLVDGSVAIDSYAYRCKVGDACSHPEPSAGRTWTVHLPAGTLSGTYLSQRFIVLHEIGHAVWSMVFRQADRDAFAAAVATALHGQDCVTERNTPCAPLHEMFADEFSRWAGNFTRCMDGYYTPALVSGPAFGAIVDEALAARS
jgi:hypothetical protein